MNYMQSLNIRTLRAGDNTNQPYLITVTKVRLTKNVLYTKRLSLCLARCYKLFFFHKYLPNLFESHAVKILVLHSNCQSFGFNQHRQIRFTENPQIKPPECPLQVINIYYAIMYILLTYSLHGAGSFLRSQLVCSWSRNSPRFMEPEGSSPHSQVPATCPYPEPAQSSPHNLIPPPEGPS